MLKELTRADWLALLQIPAQRIPEVLLLRGTRMLGHHYRAYQRYFTNVLEIGSPNAVLKDIFIGDLNGRSVAYASVYGAPMASEVVHAFGVIGVSLVIQTGCCGALDPAMETGDIFVATKAFCGEGAAQYYWPEKTIPASTALNELLASSLPPKNSLAQHHGPIYTTSALLAEGVEDVNRWSQQGYRAVDMETATTFAVAQHFGLQRASILYVFDNPLRQEHILLTDRAREARREAGNEVMMTAVLKTIRQYESRQ